MLDYDSKVAAQVIGGTWGGIAYGTSDVSEALRATIYSAITRQVGTMSANGQLSTEDRTRILTAAKAGIFLFPALTSQMAGDALLKVGFYRMMNDSGYWSLKKTVMGQLKKAAEDEAMAAAKSAATWNVVSESMQWISGQKVVDKIASYMAKIKGEVKKARDLDAQAKATLSPARYAKVRTELDKIGPKLTYLSTILPGASGEVGWTGLGAVPLALIIGGSVLIVLAVIAAYITDRVADALTINNQQVEDQRKEEVAAAKARADALNKAADSKYASDIALIDAQLKQGRLTPEQAAALKAAAAAERDATKAGIASALAADVGAAGAKADEGRLSPGTEVGKALSGAILPLAVAGAAVGIAFLWMRRRGR